METAVEWLVENLIPKPNWVQRKVIEQAKEMEKEQIKEANLFGWREALDESVFSLDTDKYYNETFKSE
jgi:3-mercaptopyruvate sulfurtransferase SseA